MRWLVIAALAACGGNSAAPDAIQPDAAAPDIDGLDVVVSSTGVVVWVGFTGILMNNGRFAAPGSCGGQTDGLINAPTCFAGIDIDNTSVDSVFAQAAANPYVSSRPVSASSMLSASDCGRSIQIPLHAGPFPTASNVTGMRSGQSVVVSWMTTAPFTIASVRGSLVLADCTDAGASEHTFPFGGNEPQLTVSVQPLTAPEITHTDLGDVRVWYGDRTDFTVP